MATMMGWREELRPGVALRELVQQATAALIVMDPDRLEELAQCCADLNRDSHRVGASELPSQLKDPRQKARLLKAIDGRIACQLHADADSGELGNPALAPANVVDGTAMDLRILEQILAETRANLKVFSHLHSLRIAAAEIPSQISRAASLSAIDAAGEFDRRSDYGDD